MNRLYGVLNTQLEGRDFITGDYSIADMIAFPWISVEGGRGLMIDDFPRVKAWHARIDERPAVQRALAVRETVHRLDLQGGSQAAQDSRKILFGQRART